MAENTSRSKKPTHRVLAIIGDDQNRRFVPIGALWQSSTPGLLTGHIELVPTDWLERPGDLQIAIRTEGTRDPRR